jgi:hypothetical protein
MIHTLLNISKNLDQKNLRLAKDSEEKAKRFSKLERHKHLLVLNMTENDPKESSRSEPTDFCHAFLLKSTVYRAKEALLQVLKTKEIFFNPLYSLFFSTLHSGFSLAVSRSSTPELDQGYALLEKINKSDVQ